MATAGNKEEQIKDNLEIVKEKIPIILKEAEDPKIKILIESAKSLEEYIKKIGEKYSKVEKYIEDMNEACNNMFNYMRENKLGKPLKIAIKDTVVATFHINELCGMNAIYIQQFDNGRYEGEMKDGKREGHGKFFYVTGDYYEGEFKNNYKNGKGKYVFSNKDVYEGEYKDGKIHGKNSWKRQIYIYRRRYL